MLQALYSKDKSLEKDVEMKPYKNITTHHLGLLLLLARATAYVGFLFTIVAIMASAIGFITLSLASVMPMLAFIPMAVSVLFFSGVMAAIVAFEESYRKRTEHLVSSNEI
jgi:hypothetical protein